MQAWADEQLATAPAELGGGFVTFPYRSLEFFSLQTALGDSCYTSLYIAVGVVCVVLAIVAGNVIIAVYTALTVALIMATVTGILVSAGWELGIMESIIMSCGIGMACDFAAHLGFAYRMANLSGEANTRAALVGIAARKLGPSLTAAAISTATMGVAMCMSKTIFMLKFGLFILLLMLFGWLYAFFFLLPLLASFGPLGNWGEFPWKWKKGDKAPSQTTPQGATL